MPTMLNEFELFRLYSKEVKNFLKSSLFLSRYPVDENVTVEYATPPRAFVKFLVPVINGGNLNPTVTFYLDSMEYLEGENLLGFVKQSKLNGTKYEMVSAPLIYKLNYKAVIMVATPSDGDVLQFQLLAAARKNKKHWSKLDGQWVEIVAHSPVDESPAEPAENDKVYRRSVMITVPRAYLPMEYITSGIIEQVNVKLDTAGVDIGFSVDKSDDKRLVGWVIPEVEVTGDLLVSYMAGSSLASSGLNGVVSKTDNLKGYAYMGSKARATLT